VKQPSTRTTTTTTTTPAPARSSGGIAVLVVVLLPHVPIVSLVVRPLVWLSTLMHELGHGTAQMALGAGLRELVIWPSAAGVAVPERGVDDVSSALIGLGGLVGPAIASAGFLVLGIVPRVARVSLVAVGLACIALALTKAGGFAVVVAGVWGFCFVVAGLVLSGERARVALLVFAVDLAGSVFSRGDYLFMATAKTDGGELPSDVASIASHLGGHYLAWGLAIAFLSVLLLGAGLAAFFAGESLRTRWFHWRNGPRQQP
jgi:hypothetical protein